MFKRLALHTALSPRQVYLNEDLYQRNHQRKPPAGQGSWMFSQSDKPINFGTAKSGVDYFEVSGTKAEAYAKAKEWAAKQGHLQIYVLP